MKVLIGIVFLTCCYSGEMKVTGSCLSYGHSCWGAHGKRSDVEALSPPIVMDHPKMRATPERWAYIKLMQSRMGRDLAAPILQNNDQSELMGNNVLDLQPMFGKMEKVFDDDSQAIDLNLDSKKHYVGSDLNGNNGVDVESLASADDIFDTRHLDYYNAKNPVFRRIFN